VCGGILSHCLERSEYVRVPVAIDGVVIGEPFVMKRSQTFAELREVVDATRARMLEQHRFFTNGTVVVAVVVVVIVVVVVVVVVFRRRRSRCRSFPLGVFDD
jgi:hypothetical protein